MPLVKIPVYAMTDDGEMQSPLDCIGDALICHRKPHPHAYINWARVQKRGLVAWDPESSEFVVQDWHFKW